MVKLHLFLFGTISCLAGRNLHPENLLQRQLSFVAGLPYYLAVFFTSEETYFCKSHMVSFLVGSNIFETLSEVLMCIFFWKAGWVGCRHGRWFEIQPGF